ncbi:hypothetical protein EDB80DRAFT_879344 [Ilyonectria destructans]|nr:hypothetical protein EDB80DRAFT_879344 [Ilyonectria destructans]
MLFRDHRPDYEVYENLYRHLHANAELSWQEHETAATVAQTLHAISPDLDIRTGIAGTGLIAILLNGTGATVLLRADMDGLPVEEMSGVSYACTKKMVDDNGDLQPVMHACGHDMHVAAMLAAADVLVSARQHWTGTVVFLFQPAEEKGAGAKAMVDAGLFTVIGCPIPDVVLGQHVYWEKTGSVAVRPGPILSATDGLLIKVFGRGGHGSSPHRTVDPVVLASSIVLRLQTIVSREVPPGELAVVTVGALNVGTAENIISHEAVLKVNTRSVDPVYRDIILNAIKRIVRAECAASASPREPEFTTTFSTSTIFNDQKVTSSLSQTFHQHFGDRFDPNMALVPASEDFNNLALAIRRPYCFWFFGGHDAEDWDRRDRDGTLDGVPMNHSPFFAPAVTPTLQTGTEAMVIGALTFLSPVGASNGI